jgi:hypothetical protein
MKNSCPYHQNGSAITSSATATITTTTTASATPTLVLSKALHYVNAPKEKQERCVYGYVGPFGDAIKPLLLVYLVGSAIGTLLFAVLSEDATMPFILSTCGHLLPEVALWTNMIFPPGTTRQNQQWMWRIRKMYLVGFGILFCFGNASSHSSVQGSSHKIGFWVTAAYVIMAGVSDFLSFWLGLLFLTRRTHHGARRLGVAFCIHGAAFHLTAYEFFAYGLRERLWGFDWMVGFSWIFLLLATVAAFLSIPALFREPLDLRKEAPTPQERKFLMLGVLFSFITVPPLAAGGRAPNLTAILSDPTFLPTDPRLLVPYKMGCPLLSLILSLYVLIAYVDAGVPVLPLSVQQQQQQQPKARLTSRTA